jgi:hypothetical protein
LKVKISILDDDGNSYEGEVQLKKNSKIIGKQASKTTQKGTIKSGSTSEKIVELIDENFFNTNKTITEIVNELKTKDYHFSSSDLTMPLRSLVRNGKLKKTKELPDNTKSKLWTYVRKDES